MADYANAFEHQRSFEPIDPKSRRRCLCGCERRATHRGTANGITLMTGCELSVRRWVRSPLDHFRDAYAKAKEALASLGDAK